MAGSHPRALSAGVLQRRGHLGGERQQYVWNTLWTFRERAERGPRQRVLFALQALFGATVASGIFWALIRFLLAGTDLPAYAAGNVAKVASVVVASTISFFLLRYVVFSCKRWLSGRL